MLLAALRDHANPQFSSVQLEALRLRGAAQNGRGFERNKTHTVFVDIRQRATDLLLAELREAGVAAVVGAEMDRILRRLLHVSGTDIRRTIKFRQPSADRLVG